MGIVIAAPTSVAVKPGAISSRAAQKHRYCSQRFISTRKYFDSAAASIVMPRTQPTNVTLKSYQVKPLATSSSDGEKTNTNGTSALAMPSLKAVLPVLNGSLPAMPAAA